MRGTTYSMDDIQFAEFCRLRLNAMLAERGETYRSTVESWSALRVVAEAMVRVRSVLGARDGL